MTNLFHFKCRESKRNRLPFSGRHLLTPKETVADRLPESPGFQQKVSIIMKDHNWEPRSYLQYLSAAANTVLWSHVIGLIKSYSEQLSPSCRKLLLTLLSHYIFAEYLLLTTDLLLPLVPILCLGKEKNLKKKITTAPGRSTQKKKSKRISNFLPHTCSCACGHTQSPEP